VAAHVCNVWNCNTEAWLKIMEWYCSGDSKKPLCKAIWLVCERHAKMLSDEKIVSRIQILHWDRLSNQRFHLICTHLHDYNGSTCILEDLQVIFFHILYRSHTYFITKFLVIRVSNSNFRDKYRTSFFGYFYIWSSCQLIFFVLDWRNNITEADKITSCHRDVCRKQFHKTNIPLSTIDVGFRWYLIRTV